MRSVVERLRADPGNPDLWTVFYRAFHGPVYYLLHRFCGGDTSLAEDLCQEAFLRFIKYNALSKVQDEASALAFLRTTARNVFYSHLESSRRARTVSIDDLSEKEGLQVAARGQSVPSVQQDASLDVERFAMKLSPREREMLGMSLAGFSLSEMAAAQGIRYGTAAIRLHRLKHRLRQIARTRKESPPSVV